ncbi:MAG: M28 family peptidase [Candidatus Krumholzibacteriota bacterium]|nr:M28 family peptidase [Candidatus Krumholzibacteriota bacterium]
MFRMIALLVMLLIPQVFSACAPRKDTSRKDEEGPLLSRQEMQSVVEFLSLDLLEGRAPGTRGGELAEHYVKSAYKLLDIAPYGGDYFQDFTLKGYTLRECDLELDGIPCSLGEDVVGNYPRDEKSFSLEKEAVFAGFGIVSPDWSWNDYRDVSVKDKIVIVRVNEPGGEDPGLFEGPALTYYGRWSYKIEEAARQGAKGILLIHTDRSAGYGWHVVRNSWGGEELYLESALENNLAFRGWIREEKLRRVLRARGISLDDLYARSNGRDFRPVDLGVTVNLAGRNEFRSFRTRNVVGYIPGSDPDLKERAVLLSAHIDHLGMDTTLSGDQIYNGAIDNGSAVASLVMTAKILKERQSRLRYSVIVLACQAEESGLLGSSYFAGSISPEKVVANINFESTPVWERTGDIMAIGARYSTLEDILKEILREQNLDYSYFSMHEQGFFYRSDQFSFARRGIPSLWISAGEDYAGGENHIRDFFQGDYHTVRDEYDPAWKMEGTLQTIRITVLLTEYINQRLPVIEWKGKMTFPVEK